jgi:hypothetical protein
MILIGSLGRNSGKTTLATELIRRWKDSFPITALKVTPVESHNGACHRGGAGCGACSGFTGGFMLEQARDGAAGKDTDLMLAAGARQAFWLRSLRENLGEAFAAFLEHLPADALVICESNSLARLLRPACFIMLAHSRDYPGKPGARELIPRADMLLEGAYTARDIAEFAGRITITWNEANTPLVSFIKQDYARDGK